MIESQDSGSSLASVPSSGYGSGTFLKLTCSSGVGDACLVKSWCANCASGLCLKSGSGGGFVRGGMLSALSTDLSAALFGLVWLFLMVDFFLTPLLRAIAGILLSVAAPDFSSVLGNCLLLFFHLSLVFHFVSVLFRGTEEFNTFPSTGMYFLMSSCSLFFLSRLKKPASDMMVDWWVVAYSNARAPP